MTACRQLVNKSTILWNINVKKNINFNEKLKKRTKEPHTVQRYTLHVGGESLTKLLTFLLKFYEKKTVKF